MKTMSLLLTLIYYPYHVFNYNGHDCVLFHLGITNTMYTKSFFIPQDILCLAYDWLYDRGNEAWILQAILFILTYYMWVKISSEKTKIVKTFTVECTRPESAMSPWSSLPNGVTEVVCHPPSFGSTLTYETASSYPFRQTFISLCHSFRN